MCGRIGGEEFVLVLSHIAKEDVLTATERIRRQLEAERFAIGANVVSVTASFGISGFQGNRAPQFNELLRAADTALYAAKRNGRNRVEFATTLCVESEVLAAHT